jgi:hypothetical protein
MVRAKLSRLATGHPTLMFSVAAGDNQAPELTGVTVKLPTGLHLATGGLSGAVSVSGARPRSATLNGNALKIALASPSEGFTVTIGAPGLTLSHTLVVRARHHRTKRVTLHATALEAGGATAAVSHGIKV